jgi:hypothetical protein
MTALQIAFARTEAIDMPATRLHGFQLLAVSPSLGAARITGKRLPSAGAAAGRKDTGEDGPVREAARSSSAMRAGEAVKNLDTPVPDRFYRND